MSGSVTWGGDAASSQIIFEFLVNETYYFY